MSSLRRWVMVMGSAVALDVAPAQQWQAGLAPWAVYGPAAIAVAPFWGGIEFDATGSTMYTGSWGVAGYGTIEALPVLRTSATGRIFGFGAPTTVTSTQNIDAGLVRSGGLYFYTTWPTNRLGQSNGSVQITPSLPAVTSSTGGLAFVPAWLPGGGGLLVSSYTNGSIWSVSLGPVSGGFYQPTSATLYASLPLGTEGIRFVETGPSTGDLLVANASSDTLAAIDVDLWTGQPVGGATNPTVTVLATGISQIEGLAFDPVTGDLFISTFGPDLMYQIGDFAWLTTLSADATTLSASLGGSIPFRVRAGSLNAGRPYLIAAGASGTSPGTNAGSVVIPLNIDVLTTFVLANVNTPTFDFFLGLTGPAGEATATLNLPPLPGVSAAVTVDLAGILLAPVDFATNAVTLTILP